MKKFMMAAVALICMTMTSVAFISCGDDDDSQTAYEPTPNTYEVTLSAVLPESAAAFFTLDLEYAGGDGQTTKATVKAGDKSDAMSDNFKSIYNKSKESVITQLNWADKMEKRVLFDQLIVKNFSFSVPAGKSFSYKATMKARTDYTQPSTDTVDIVMPFVYMGSKRISGDSQDNSFFTERLKLLAYGAVETESLAEFLKMFDGDVVVEEKRTMN